MPPNVTTPLLLCLLVSAAVPAVESQGYKYRLRVWPDTTLSGSPREHLFTDLYRCNSPFLDAATSCSLSMVSGLPDLLRFSIHFHTDCQEGSGSQGNLTIGRPRLEYLVDLVPEDTVGVWRFASRSCVRGDDDPPYPRRMDFRVGQCAETGIDESVMVRGSSSSTEFELRMWDRDPQHVCSGTPVVGPVSVRHDTCLSFRDGTSLRFRY